jgi:hypothetical protein
VRFHGNEFAPRGVPGLNIENQSPLKAVNMEEKTSLRGPACNDGCCLVTSVRVGDLLNPYGAICHEFG